MNADSSLADLDCALLRYNLGCGLDGVGHMFQTHHGPVASKRVVQKIDIGLKVVEAQEQLVTQFGLVAAGGVISVIPITLFVIFAQQYLIAGLSSGAVKE